MATVAWVAKEVRGALEVPEAMEEMAVAVDREVAEEIAPVVPEVTAAMVLRGCKGATRLLEVNWMVATEVMGVTAATEVTAAMEASQATVVLVGKVELRVMAAGEGSEEMEGSEERAEMGEQEGLGAPVAEGEMALLEDSAEMVRRVGMVEAVDRVGMEEMGVLARRVEVERWQGMVATAGPAVRVALAVVVAEVGRGAWQCSWLREPLYGMKEPSLEVMELRGVVVGPEVSVEPEVSAEPVELVVKEGLAERVVSVARALLVEKGGTVVPEDWLVMEVPVELREQVASVVPVESAVLRASVVPGAWVGPEALVVLRDWPEREERADWVVPVWVVPVG
ncbi:hypothetical protein HNR46_001987 [Haloferula luteola]|uniref:Uncharacterized protein n=1 Tax=Haloferula luteola TaxID=595692 RepID=A0A840VAN7_9BACT|nr:hypothetical protein [Haloferula luteola]MBB5351748.1 hypothetical protein [Haloferula luteola]